MVIKKELKGGRDQLMWSLLQVSIAMFLFRAGSVDRIRRTEKIIGQKIQKTIRPKKLNILISKYEIICLFVSRILQKRICILRPSRIL